MMYILEAIIGSESALRKVVLDQPNAVFVPLKQGVALVPMTDKFLSAVTDGTSDRPLGFWKLPGGFEPLLAEWSEDGPVGYVEAEFYGGYGGQRAALWVDGKLALGPLVVGDGERFTADGSERFAVDGSPISQILRRLGVVKDNFYDEFEAVGLGRHQHTSEWQP
jgi:hypothetical protein